MARTTIFPTQEILYDFLFMDMVPAASIIPAPFALEPGQTYAVQWGENLFENLSVIDLADAGFTGGAIGNCSGFELPGNNEPFAIAYFADDTGGEIVVFFLDGSDSQTITVYQGADTPIVLKDRTGTGIEYEGVEGVRVFDKDGNPHVFVPPVEREEKTVELDFSGGAMEITPTAGKLLSKVGIPVPENLLPENIAKDVDIAGVVGTHEGGGAGDADAYAEYTTNENGEVVAAKLYGFTTIPEGMFAYCTKLESVDASQSPGITRIEKRAFYYCESLKSFNIPETVTYIGDYAFQNCLLLTGIELPACLETLCIYAFQKCTSIERLTIPAGVTFAGNSVFGNCSALKKLIFEDGLTSIGGFAFSDCAALTSVTIPASVKAIDSYAFVRCTSLTSATFEDASGWYYTSNKGATSGTSLTLTNKATAASYLSTQNTYAKYYWYDKT